MALKNKISSLLLSLFLSPSVFAGTCLVDGKVQGTSIFKEGVTLIELYGSYQQMGYCYGKLTAPQLQQFYQFTKKELNFNSPLDKFILWLSKVTLPQKDKEILEGISQGSGLSYQEIIRINFSTDLLFLQKNKPRSEGIGCSDVFASGSKTSTDGAIVGRNYDMPARFFGTYLPYMAIATYHPQGEYHAGHQPDHAVTTIGYVGMLSGLSALNDRGLFTEINSAMLNFPFPRLNLFVPPDPMLQNFNILFDTDSLQDLDSYYQTHLTPVAVMVGVADKQLAYHVERSPFQYGKALQLDENGQVHFDLVSSRFDIFTNTFALKWFGMKSIYSLQNDSLTQPFLRHANLQRLVHQAGVVSGDNLKEIMTRPIDKGGAFQVAGPGKFEATAYSLVVDMKNQRLWLYVPDAQAHWVYFNMGHA